MPVCFGNIFWHTKPGRFAVLCCFRCFVPGTNNTHARTTTASAPATRHTDSTASANCTAGWRATRHTDSTASANCTAGWRATRHTDSTASANCTAGWRGNRHTDSTASANCTAGWRHQGGDRGPRAVPAPASGGGLVDGVCVGPAFCVLGRVLRGGDVVPSDLGARRPSQSHGPFVRAPDGRRRRQRRRGRAGGGAG
eukprot:COSAG01_NODE_2297_length_7966_cov_145.938604_6_plen_197_part_00